MEKQNSNVLLWVGVLIAIVIATVSLTHNPAPLQEQAHTVGSSVNGGNVSDFTAVNTDVGYWVAGATKVINSSGVWLKGILSDSLAQFDAGILHSSTLSTSTPASVTLAASDISGIESIVMLPSATLGITATLPASSTLSAVVPTAGDWAESCITNATTTTGASITIAGGTGTNLLVASSSATALGSKVLLPGKTGCIRFFRIGAGNNSSDINALLTVFQ